MPPPSPLTNSAIAETLGLPSQASSSAMIALYSAALGPVQLPRYLALFERFDRSSRDGRIERAPLGWNLASSLLTLDWMALHSLWKAALVYFVLVYGLALVVLGVAQPLLNMPASVEYGLLGALGLFSIALPGLFGDALLHAETRKRIGRAIAAEPNLPGACTILEKQASSKPRMFKIAAIHALLLLVLAVGLLLGSLSGGDKASASAASPSPSVDAAQALSGKVDQQAAPSQPTTLPGLLSPSSAAPPLTEPEAATPPVPLPAPVYVPVSAPEPIPAPAPQPAPTPAPAPIPEPEPAPAPVIAPPKAEKKIPAVALAAVPEKAAEKAPEKALKTTKKAADKASAKLRKKAALAPAANPAKPIAAAAPAAAEKALVPLVKVPARAASDGPLPMVGTAAGHYLNAGTFAEVGNARRAQAKLLNAGLPAFRQTVASPKGEMIRVRVGPYNSAAEAQKAAQQIRRMGLEAVAFRQRAQ